VEVKVVVQVSIQGVGGHHDDHCVVVELGEVRICFFLKLIEFVHLFRSA
jgi:hypothetical protein